MARRSTAVWERLADALFEPTMDTLLVGATGGWALLLWVLFQHSGAASAITLLVIINATSLAIIWALVGGSVRHARDGRS